MSQSQIESHQRPHECPICGYNTQGLGGAACPECGNTPAIVKDADVRAAQQFRSSMLAILICVVLLVFLAVQLRLASTFVSLPKQSGTTSSLMPRLMLMFTICFLASAIYQKSLGKPERFISAGSWQWPLIVGTCSSVVIIMVIQALVLVFTR